MITSANQKPPLDKMPPSAHGFERGLDPWHKDAFPDHLKEAGTDGKRVSGWIVLDAWGNEIGFIPDGTEFK